MKRRKRSKKRRSSLKNHPPHVLYVLTKLELGGAQKICLTLLKGMQSHELSSSLVSGAHGVLVDEAKEHKSTYLLKSLKREVGIFTIFHEFAAFFGMIKLMRQLKKQHPNLVVHTHSTKAGLMGRWAAFFARVKKRLHTVHGFGFHDHQSRIGWYINFLFEYLTSFITTHYVCVSHADRRIGKKYFRKFAKKSSVIRAAVDWERFYQPARAEAFTSEAFTSNEFVFGTISCLKPQKNLLDLFKAFKLLLEQAEGGLNPPVGGCNARLQIVGDGVQRPMLEAWLEKNGMKDKVDFLGWQDDVSPFLQKWDAFVMSSLWEGLPCAIVEARLCKLPVISYKVAGIPEVIKSNQNGFLVRPGNWTLLSKKMKELMENHELFSKLSSYADNLDDFRDIVMVEKHATLYKKLR